MNNWKKFCLCYLIVPLLSLYCTACFADAVSNEVQWMVNLWKQNNGRTFCTAPTTTLNELGNAFAQYSHAHPEFHDKLTDQQVIQAFAERYPCPKGSSPIVATSVPTNTSGKTILVTPKGEYSSIDVTASSQIMQKLTRTNSHENDDLVNQIVKNSGNYLPPVLFSLAALYYRQGDEDNALFWLNAGRLRGIYDAKLCTDPSAASAVSDMTRMMPAELTKHQFDDLAHLNGIVDKVILWDETTPYNYDHRWISLHGMGAISSGLGNAQNNNALTVPRENWEDLAIKNRVAYRKLIVDVFNVLQKQKSSSNAESSK